MLLHVPTLFAVIIMVSLVLAIAIALVGYRQHRERFVWAAGLTSQALAYILFALRNAIPDWPSIVLANALLSLSFALYTVGILTFRGLQWPRRWIWGPVGLAVMGFWLLMPDNGPRLVFASLLYLLQTLLLIAAVLQRRRQPVLRGEWLIILGAALMSVLMLFRLWTVLSGALRIQFVTDGGWIQGLTFLLAITSTLMLAIGLIIMSEERAEHAMQQQALHDSLTQLPNRGLLMARLEQAMAAQKRQGHHGALMFIDLDNFKPLNDRHGHALGDLLLIEVAKRLGRRVREMDTVARFGGDEFVVLLTELNGDAETATRSATEVADQLLGVLSAPYVLRRPDAPSTAAPITHQCTASIGLAVFNGNAPSAEFLLQRADAAMYQAKAAGRNQVHLLHATATAA